MRSAQGKRWSQAQLQTAIAPAIVPNTTSTTASIGISTSIDYPYTPDTAHNQSQEGRKSKTKPHAEWFHKMASLRRQVKW